MIAAIVNPSGRATRQNTRLLRPDDELPVCDRGGVGWDSQVRTIDGFSDDAGSESIPG